MSTYGQFCPVAKALELLDERWTLLIIRELLSGSRHWADLREGVPRMSPTLLSKRLRTLVRAGVIERRTEENRVAYVPTQACEELRPAVEALGTWGMRWMPELGDEDLDPRLLLWDMHRRLDLDAMPGERIVIQFTFSDVEPFTREWWIVVANGEVDLCDADPGFEVDIKVECHLRTLTVVWRGDQRWLDAVKSGALSVEGPARMRSRLPQWLQLSSFAGVARPPRRATSASH